MQSVMTPQKNFAKNPSIGSIQRSTFNRTHGYKSAFDSGYLIPFYCDEVLPTDSIKLKANIFARLSSPLDHPIMDNLFLDTQYFYVPNRLLWDNWQKFMGERVDPSDSIDYTVPTINLDVEGDFTPESIYDYMGIPCYGNIGSEVDINALHLRAYMLIWNEWYRDENIQDSEEIQTGDGPDSDAQYYLKKRNKRHDYFTSCLPWPQKGDAVSINLTGDAPVIGDGSSLGLSNSGTNYGLYVQSTTGINIATTHKNQTLPYNASPSGFGTLNDALGVTTSATQSGLIADLTDVSAVTINQLRDAIATQQVLELDARAGTRYKEILMGHFQSDIGDARLQRPEYLGGGSHQININPVTQTSESNTTYQGNQSAHGTMSGRSGFTKSFTEHGVVIGLCSVRADLTYQQGLNKMWSRQTRYDYYLPAFANLGEQAVLSQEIMVDTDVNNATVFGYQERWADLRYKPSLITGKMRSNITTPSESLDAWHLSQDFSSVPTLSNAFIQENVPLDRVLTVTTEPEIIFDSLIEIQHTRPLPVFSIPGLGRL